jgi:hypothetical protein
MPIKSAAQFRLMEGALHGDIKGKGKPSKYVAGEMLEKTSHKSKSNFAKGNTFAKALTKKKGKPY